MRTHIHLCLYQNVYVYIQYINMNACTRARTHTHCQVVSPSVHDQHRMQRCPKVSNASLTVAFPCSKSSPAPAETKFFLPKGDTLNFVAQHWVSRNLRLDAFHLPLAFPVQWIKQAGRPVVHPRSPQSESLWPSIPGSKMMICPCQIKKCWAKK